MNSCSSIPLPACFPPFITLLNGIGIVNLPFKSWNGCLFWLAALARNAARLTPRIAFAPNRCLFFVPSSLILFESISFWRLTSIPFRAGLKIRLILFTAFFTPLLANAFPPSRSSTASCTPVEAPDGTRAVPLAFLVETVADIVGVPRESRTHLELTFFIVKASVNGRPRCCLCCST